MANEDLSKLKIDRGGSTDVTKRKRRKRPMVTLIAAAALVLIRFLFMLFIAVPALHQ